MAILKSGLTKYYGRHFVLDEDSLRRMQAILDKAAKELPSSPEVVFRVEREDDRFYETLSIEDVLADPNVERRRIKTVYIELRPDEANLEDVLHRRKAIVSLEFAAEEGFSALKEHHVRIEISHDNRNWALLLADELEPQIQRTFKSKGIPLLVFVVFLIPLAMVFLKIYRKSFPDAANIEVIKIMGQALFMIFLVLGMLSFFIYTIGRPKWYSRMLGPESVFLWGDEAHAYNTRYKTRQNIFWGVIVAFVVSFAAGGVWLLF